MGITTTCKMTSTRTILGFFVTLSCLAFYVNAIPTFSLSQNEDDYADEISRPSLAEIENSLIRQIEANLRNHALNTRPDSLAPFDMKSLRSKKNYNLDHLARMNFRRSYRASKFNNRHILGGLLIFFFFFSFFSPSTCTEVY